MNNNIKKRIVPVAFGFLFALGVATLLVRAAISVNLYLAPSSRSVGIGSNLSIAVRMNTQGNAVDYARAYLNFPSDKLSVSSISPAGTDFDYQLEATVSGNQIRITRYSTTGPKSGDLLIANVTFSTLNTGNATISFDAGSAAYYTGGGSSQPTTLNSGGSYTIVTVAPPPPPPPGPIAPPPPPVAPVTTTPVTPVETAPPPQQQPAGPPTDPSPSTVPTALIEKKNSNEELYPVIITVKNNDKKPAAGVEVSSGQATVLTNDLGSAALLLPAGEHAVYVKSAKVSKQFTVKVAPTSVVANSLPQEFSLELPNPNINGIRIVKILFAITFLMAATGFLWFFIGKRPKHHRTTSKNSTTTEHNAHDRQPGRHAALSPSIESSAKSEESPIIPSQTSHTPQSLADPEAHHKASEHSKVGAIALHPHNTAKTIQPPSQDSIVAIKPLPSPLEREAPQATKAVELPAPMAAKTAVIPKAEFTPLPPKPEQKSAPKQVDPYKPDGEPKDIFEMAEERFSNDDRLKDLR